MVLIVIKKHVSAVGEGVCACKNDTVVVIEVILKGIGIKLEKHEIALAYAFNEVLYLPCVVLCAGDKSLVFGNKACC